MKNIFKYIGILATASVIGMMFTSCAEKLPVNEVQPYGTKLTGIRIVNAGPNQDKEVEGTVDTTTMTISFPRISAKSNFAELRFAITADEGATLEQETYDFSMGAEETDKSQVIKVVNHNRYTEWICKVGKIAPLKGADFDKAVLYKIEGADTPIKDNRWASFDGRNAVLSGPKFSTAISLQNIIAGKKDFVNLDVSTCSGGTFPANCAEAVNGHVYVASLAGGTISPLKIYYYETPDAQPEVVWDMNPEKMGFNAGGAGRFGDSFNAELDEKGNGYMFFISNGNTDPLVLRLSVRNHKEISNPVFLEYKYGERYNYNTVTRISEESYILGGCNYPIIVNENMKATYEFEHNFALKELTELRVIEFNKERYLLGIVMGRLTPSAVLQVYNITKGKTIEEAIDYLLAEDELKPLISQTVGGAHGGAAFGAANYYIEKDANGKDSKLYLFGSAKNEGITLIEVPVKKLQEEE